MARNYSDPKKAGALMEADACGLVLKELERLIDRYQRKVDKEADKRREEFEQVMGYRSESDIQDAYGWGYISKTQYERYVDLFQAGSAALEQHTPTVTERACAILRSIRVDVMGEQQDYRYGAMSPDELRAEIKRQQDAERAWKTRMDELKSHRRSIEAAEGADT